MDEISPTDAKTIRTILREKREESAFMGLIKKVEKKKESSRILVVGKFRVYEFKQGSKSDCKLEASGHVLDLQEIASPNSNEVRLVFSNYKISVNSSKSNEIINAVRLAFNTAFGGAPDEERYKMNIVPESRATVLPAVTDLALCGYANAYQAMCDLFGVVVREDIVWDLVNVFPASNVKEFNLREFEQPLSTGDIRCLLGALHYNKHFHSLIADNFIFPKESFDALGQLMRRNTHASEIILPTCSLNRDALKAVGEGLASNKKTAINKLILRDNQFEEKGASYLANAIKTMGSGLIALDLSRCQLPKAGIAAIGNALQQNIFMASTLTELIISHNKFEPEGSAALASFLAKPNGVRKLDISFSSPNLEVVLAAIVRGCQELQYLDVSGNKITIKEAGHLSKYLQASATLRELRIDNTEVRIEFLKDIMRAIAANFYLQDFTLSAAGNPVGQVGGNIIGNIIAEAKNITCLDVSENEFGDDGIAALTEGLCSNTSLSTLKLGRNWSKTATKQRLIALENIISLMSGECPLKSLSLDGNNLSNLKTDIITFLNALGTNDSLTFLDISGNQMANKGAMALAKAIQTNTTLTTLWWDDNLTTTQGFQSFKMGLERNHTLRDMPLPVLDIGATLRSEQPDKAKEVQNLLSTIQNLLANNTAPRKIIDSTKKTQNISVAQSRILSSGEREQIERLRFKIKSLGRQPNSEQQAVIADAENNDSTLSSLHFLAEEVQYAMADKLKESLRSVAASVQPVFSDQYRELISRLMGTVQQNYKSMDNNTVRRLGMSINLGGKDLELEQIEKVLVDTAADELASKASECFMSAVQLATDYIYEKLTDSLQGILDDMQNSRATATPSTSSTSSTSEIKRQQSSDRPTSVFVAPQPTPQPQPQPTPQPTPQPQITKESSSVLDKLPGARPVSIFGTGPLPTLKPTSKISNSDSKSSTSGYVSASASASTSNPTPTATTTEPSKPSLPPRKAPPAIPGGHPGAGSGGSSYVSAANASITTSAASTSEPSVPLPKATSGKVASSIAARMAAVGPLAMMPPGAAPKLNKVEDKKVETEYRPEPSKAAPKVPPPKKVVPKPSAPTKSSTPAAAAATTVVATQPIIEEVPIVESTITHHATRDRPMVQKKRRPPTRRPRGPMADEEN
eukprot:TRINITY_DN1224_c4_g1_i1.p1 TRINITY_DN1224_c4_g1~~TRINITY_DN1224_c4_g1_i1.p1  ORF type:complete len:1158 (-),score=655.33 TRINITY_DN1224_c4_g1_i1:200-3643(-)